MLALARPAVVLSVPANQTTIILAMDVSGSMCSTDIEPTRLEAAEDAAIAFVTSQSSRTQIGLVAFSGFAAVVQPPTSDQQRLVDAIRSLTTGRRTAIGSGILAAIDAIAEVDPTVARSVVPGRAGAAPPPVAEGAYAPDIIVAADRRREQRRPGAGRRGPPGGRSRAAGLHDRVRVGRWRRARPGLSPAVHRQRAAAAGSAAGSAVAAAAGSGAASTSRPCARSPS